MSSGLATGFTIVPHILFIKDKKKYRAKWLYCRCGNTLDGEYDVVEILPGNNPVYSLYLSCTECGFYVRGKGARMITMAFQQGII